MKGYLLCVAISALFLLLACQDDTPQAVLQLDFEWSKPNECSETSPEIRISGLPETTHSLRVRLIDLYQPGADHGGWEQIPVPAGGVISAGGLQQYRGPCPLNITRKTIMNLRWKPLIPTGWSWLRGNWPKNAARTGNRILLGGGLNPWTPFSNETGEEPNFLTWQQN